MTDGQHNALFSSVLTACKVHHLCGRCGRIRAPKTALSPNQKNCPPPPKEPKSASTIHALTTYTLNHPYGVVRNSRYT